jgi:hypothetical protein
LIDILNPLNQQITRNIASCGPDGQMTASTRRHFKSPI